jgi:hypothetical protein
MYRVLQRETASTKILIPQYLSGEWGPGYPSGENPSLAMRKEVF